MIPSKPQNPQDEALLKYLKGVPLYRKGDVVSIDGPDGDKVSLEMLGDFPAHGEARALNRKANTESTVTMNGHIQLYNIIKAHRYQFERPKERKHLVQLPRRNPSPLNKQKGVTHGS